MLKKLFLIRPEESEYAYINKESKTIKIIEKILKSSLMKKRLFYQDTKNRVMK